MKEFVPLRPKKYNYVTDDGYFYKTPKQSCFEIPKDITMNCTPLFIMKIPDRKELQRIFINPSSDINFKDLMKLYRKCTTKPYYTTIASDNRLSFQENLMEEV